MFNNPCKVWKDGKIVSDIYLADLPVWESQGWTYFDGVVPQEVAPEKVFPLEPEKKKVTKL